MTDGSPPALRAAPDATDAAIIARALGGDATAFDEIVRRHYRGAYAVALAVLSNAADAEDVCHDAFVHGLARLEECRQPDRFGQWMAAIVRNRARNELTRAGARRTVTLEPDVHASDASLTLDVERGDLRVALESALGTLTDVQREVVLLHDLYDWPHDAIAERIGTSAGMSRQHLFKARRRLREALGPDLLRDHFDD